MVAASPHFYIPVLRSINLVLIVVVLVVELFAFINCLTQRADAFPAVGAIPKGGWLALTGGAIIFTLLLGWTSIFGMIAVAAALIFLLDVRPALREVTGGSGPW
jgi:hypothetical protein